MTGSPVSACSLRIAHIHPVAFDIFGHQDEDWGRSVKYFLTNVAAAQVRQGDRPVVHLLTSSRAQRFVVDGIDVRLYRCIQPPRSLPVTKRFGRQISWPLLKAIRSGNADVVHFHGACHLQAMFGAVAHRARQQRLPFVAQDQGPRDGRWIEQRLLKFGLERSDAVLASSAQAYRRLVAIGVPTTSLHIGPNGFDQRIFFPGPRRDREPREPFRILVVSRLWEDKDPLTMADAICELVRRGHAVAITIVGQGIMRSEVEERLRRVTLDLTFIEHMPQEQLAQLYRVSDALVLTSLREGWNCAVVEAMASGLPIVATEIDGTRDAVEDAAMLVPVRRPTLVADALEQLATRPGLAANYRERGLKRSARYTWDAAVGGFRQIYLDLIEHRRVLRRPSPPPPAVN